MAANTTRTEEQYEQRLSEVASLYKEGKTQQQIADEIGNCSRRQIGYDLQELMRRWQESSLNDINAAKLKELALADFIEAEAREAWDRSCLNAEKEVTKTGKKDADGNGFELEVSTTVEGQYGDPRFLQIMSQCSKDRRDIRGVDAPKKKESNEENTLAALLISEIMKGKDLAKAATNA